MRKSRFILLNRREIGEVDGGDAAINLPKPLLVNAVMLKSEREMLPIHDLHGIMPMQVQPIFVRKIQRPC